MKSLKHKRLLAGFMAMVFVIGAIIPANLSVHASSATELVDTTANSEEEVTEPRLYDADTMQGLNATEIAVANDIVIAAGYGFDIENNFDGITYNDSAVKVSYYADKGSFDGNQAGNYETYYKVEPVSGRETYLICRTITVREPETATQSSASDNSAEESGSEDGESDGDVPDDLSAGEIEELTVEMPMMFMAVSEPLMMASAPATGTQDGPDKMKVSNAGYAKYCGHSMGIKYVSESGAYKNHLVYCLDMNKNTTNGDVSSSSTKSNVKPTITYCLVNGARTLNGTCHNKDYSSGSAAQDYFITGASIHILNGEVSLSYYNNGSSTYQKIAKMVADAKTHADEYSDNGCTISITYDISPKKTDWKDMGDGLYRSTDKFVRTKSGTVKDIKYSISGAPSGLTVGEIKTDSSQIDDEADLKKYDICVAQTDASSASSNFYLYCNEDAMKKIVDNKSTIKIVAKAYSDEKGGRKWTPSVISQQKITFLEDFTPVTAQATVKVTSNFNEGSFSLYKSDKFTHNAVPGARYYLYEDKDCTELLCKLSKTDDKGLSSSGKVILTQDKYYLKEVLEPDGYQRDKEVYEIPLSYFTLYDKDGKVIQQGKRKDVEEIPETIGVFVNKTDVGSGVVLKKAGFAVFNDPACTVRTKLEGQNGSAGEVPVFYYDADLDMAASQKFVKEQDKYYVKEVDVPDGYKDEAKIYTIAPSYGQFEKIDAVNTPVRCDLTCIKEDKETKNPQGDAKLDGALYGLYAAEDIKYPDGRDIVTYTGADNITSKSGNEFKSTGAKATKDALLATVRTDDKYAFSFGNLYYGNYYVKEIEPSEGYLLDATVYPANFKDAENTHQDISLSCTVKETVKKQAFEIIKVSTDGDTAEEDKVKDAEFTVKLKSDIDKNGWDAAKVYDIFVTDEKGYGKIDIDWTDLLWKYRGDNNIVDDEFLRYFRFICDVLCYKKEGTTQGKKFNEFDALKEYFSKEADNAMKNIELLESFFDVWCEINNECSPSEYLERFIASEHTEGKITCQIGSSNMSKAWTNLFHKSRNTRYEDTKQILNGLLSALDKVDEKELLSVIKEYVSECKQQKLYPWTYYYIIYDDFRPGKYGKMYWEDDVRKYRLRIMQTEIQASENTYDPFLYSVLPVCITREYGGRYLHIEDDYIESENDAFVVYDWDSENEIDRLPIKQNENGIDKEDRIKKLQKYLQKRYDFLK